MGQRREVEHRIRNELTKIMDQLLHGNDSSLTFWVMATLAVAHRPLRFHPRFGARYSRDITPLPIAAKPLVEQWVERIIGEGVRSIICLLEPAQLERHYVRGGLRLHDGGLLGYYESRGLTVRSLPCTDYERPAESLIAEALGAFDELPKPVLLHCSAGIDRTTPVAAFIVERRGGS